MVRSAGTLYGSEAHLVMRGARGGGCLGAGAGRGRGGGHGFTREVGDAKIDASGFI